jgi:LEA14-like dessication related protein
MKLIFIHKKLLYFFVACCLLTSCASDFQEVQFSGIESVKMINMSQKGAEAEITARIKNPNNTSFTVYKSDLDVSINGLNAGVAHLTDNVKIKSNSEESYTFKVKSDFSKLSLTDLPQLISIATSKNVKVGLKGNLLVGKFFYKKSVPVEFNESVPISK